MLCVANKPLMLSVVMLNVIMLRVMAPFFGLVNYLQISLLLDLLCDMHEKARSKSVSGLIQPFGTICYLRVSLRKQIEM